MASVLKVDKLDPQSGTALEIGTSGDTITVPTGAGLTVVDEVKTNKISPSSGVAFTLGDSGDTFTVPSGATIVNSGTATGFGGDNTPAFFATLSADVVISDDTATLAPCNTEVFDSDSAYDNSSTYRFTPQTAGKYYVFGYIQVNASAGELSQTLLEIRKNGTTVQAGELNITNASGYRTGITSENIVDLNGSSDYVDMFATGNIGGGTVTLKADTNTKTSFGAYKLIGA